MKQTNHSKAIAAIRAKVLRTIREFDLLRHGDKVLVAVSAGPDSCMLLHLLLSLTRTFSLQLGVAHVHHGARPGAADREALQVEKLARRHNLPFHLHHARFDLHSGSFEERAREARYAFFNRVAREHGYDKIALGHQADDNAEVVLMNLMRGSGTRGLSGIPVHRGERIIRPLLSLRRDAVLAYLAYHALNYMTDESNMDRRFERNRVRHDLLPQLQRTCNSDVVSTLNRMAALFRDEEQWFETYLQPILGNVVLAADARRMDMDIALMREQHPALQRRLLRQALRGWIGHLRRISAEHIETLRKILPLDTDTIAVSLPGSIMAARAGDRLRFQAGYKRCKAGPENHPGGQVRIVPVMEKEIHLDLSPWGIDMRFELEKGCGEKLPASDRDVVVFDADQVRQPLTIRSVRAGDRIVPFGMHGRKKVSDLFIDLKIPRDRRAAMALLLSGDTLLWVVGLRRSAHAPVTPATKRVLRVTRINRQADGKQRLP